jgi:uncharacterized membrane protein YbhN (UPF0104 family)
MKARLPRLLGFVVLGVSLGYLGTVAVRHASSFPPVAWTPGAVLALVSSTGLYLAMFLLGAAAWFLLLRSVGAQTSLRAVLTVCCLGQIGKYLPGNIGQYLGRAALAREHGVALHSSALTLVFETSGLIVTATAVAVLAFDRSPATPWADPWKIALLAVGAIIAPFLLIYILERWFAGLLQKRLGVTHLPRPSVATLGACLMLYTVGFLSGGFAFDQLARGLFGAGSNISWMQAIPAFALAWVAGFVTPGAPAGLGVREALLVGGTASLYGPGTALSTALAFRLITVLGDGLAFLAGAAGRRSL